MGRVYRRQGRYDLAVEILIKCTELAELIGNTQVQASALNQMGITLTHRGEYHKAIECHTKSLALLERTGFVRDQARTLLYMSDPLQFLGRYADAFSALDQAYQSARDSWTEAACQNDIGTLYAKTGNYPNALSSYLASAKTLERIGDKLNLAIIHENLMDIYLKLGSAEQARNFGEKALTIFEEIGHKHGQAGIFMGFSEYYLNRGEKTEAKRFLKRCIALSREIGIKDREAEATTKLAILEIDRSKFTDAEKLLQEALAIASEIDNREQTVAALLGLGNLFNKQTRPDQAFPFLERAITIAKEIHSHPHEQEGHQMLAEALEAKGDLVAALQHWKLASSIKEEILGTEKQKALTVLQIRSSIEKAENEKTLLKKETKFKSREIERVVMDLTEKTELLRSTSRRIKEIAKPLTTGDSHDTRFRLEELLSDLNYSIAGKKNIPNEFQLIHRNILHKLSKRYPTLTLSERKVCVLLRDGLSTKQMADMFKVSTRAIENHRYQARKKMKLGPGMSLTTVLAGM